MSGSVTVPVDQIGIGYWLAAMFGSPATSGSGDPYTHVFKVTDGQPSLVLEQQYPDIGTYETFNGCKISKFSFTYGGDTELTAQNGTVGSPKNG